MDWLHDKNAVVQEISGGIPETEASGEAVKYQRLQKRAWSILPVIANGIPTALKGGEGRKALSKLEKAIFLVNGSKKKGANLLDYVKGVVKEGAVLAESMDYERAWENAGEKGKEYFGRGKCFTGDTLIYTEQGYVPIVEIQEGDLVWSMEEETGETGLKRVEAVFCTRAHTIYEIEIEGSERISTTAYHPFYVACQGWVDAIRLRIGDVLITADGMAEITGIRKCRCDDAVKTYNFHVEDWTSYFVTEQKVYVHNPVGEHEELFDRMHMGKGVGMTFGTAVAKEGFLSPNEWKKVLRYLKKLGFEVSEAYVKTLTKTSVVWLLVEGIMEPLTLSKGDLDKATLRNKAMREIGKLKNPSLEEMRRIFNKYGLDSKDISREELILLKNTMRIIEKELLDSIKSNQKENKGKGETGISQAINSISENKRHHILQYKHNWNKLVPNPRDPNNWNKILALISLTLDKGKEEPYGSALQKILKHGKEIIAVTYKYVDGIL